jgi:hypothetical protein
MGAHAFQVGLLMEGALRQAADKIERLERKYGEYRLALQIIAYDEHPVTGALQGTAWRALEGEPIEKKREG